MSKRQKPIQWLIVAALCLFFSVVGFYIGKQLGWWLIDEGYTMTWRTLVGESDNRVDSLQYTDSIDDSDSSYYSDSEA